VVYSLVSLVQDMDAQGQWEHKTKGSQVRKMFYMDVESTLPAMRCAAGYKREDTTDAGGRQNIPCDDVRGVFLGSIVQQLKTAMRTVSDQASATPASAKTKGDNVSHKGAQSELAREVLMYNQAILVFEWFDQVRYPVSSLSCCVLSEECLPDRVDRTGALSRRSNITLEVQGLASLAMSRLRDTIVAHSRNQSSTTLDLSSRPGSLRLDRTRHVQHVTKHTQEPADSIVAGVSFHCTTCDASVAVKTTQASARHCPALCDAPSFLAPNSTSGIFVPSSYIFKSCCFGSSYRSARGLPESRENTAARSRTHSFSSVLVLLDRPAYPCI
jgi:hypothetical protein